MHLFEISLCHFFVLIENQNLLTSYEVTGYMQKHLWQSVAYAENFQGAGKFRDNCMTSQTNFRGSAAGTTILGGPGACPPEKFCKITPKNTHFCTFWK